MRRCSSPTDSERSGHRSRRRRRGRLLATVIVALQVCAATTGADPSSVGEGPWRPAVRTARRQETPPPPPPMTCRPGSIVRSVDTGGRRLVAFGFDDGPWPTTTAAVMTEFERRGVRATFFLIGAHLQKYPAIGASIVQRGHEVGNHTLSHRYTDSTILREVLPTADLIAAVTGQRPRLFRSPGLTITDRLQDGLAFLGLCSISASVFTGDSSSPRPSASTICARFVAGLRPGAIVLAHDGGGYHESTAAAVPCMLDHAIRNGYTVVTVSELLGQSVVAPFG